VQIIQIPKWLVPSLPLVGESYFAMLLHENVPRPYSLYQKRPMFRIIGASQSFFSNA